MEQLSRAWRLHGDSLRGHLPGHPILSLYKQGLSRLCTFHDLSCSSLAALGLRSALLLPLFVLPLVQPAHRLRLELVARIRPVLVLVVLQEGESNTRAVRRGTKARAGKAGFEILPGGLTESSSESYASSVADGGWMVMLLRPAGACGPWPRIDETAVIAEPPASSALSRACVAA